jgi:hypothetical protein
MDTYKKKYDEALERARNLHKDAVEMENNMTTKICEIIFPELNESEDEKVSKKLINIVKKSYEQGGYALHKWEADEMLAWLEKQGEQKTADKVEPKDYSSIDPHFAKPIDKVEPKFFKVGDWVVSNNKKSTYQVIEVKRGIYVIRDNVDNHEYHIGIEECEKSGRLFTIQDAKDGDVLVCPFPKGYEAGGQIFIFKEINSRDYVDNCIEYYCRVCEGVFYENKTGFMGTTSSTFYPATKGQRDFLFQKMKEEGYKWDVDAKKLIKTTTPIPKFKFGDIIKHKDTGVINSIKYVCSDYYVLDNNQALFFESQDMWELAASKANPSLEDKVSILADEIIALKERVKALEIQEIKQCSDKNR